MKTIVIKLFRNFLIFSFISFFISISVINGQPNLKDIPYNIDIKMNIKNLKTITLSNIGTELSYIPLETTPECLIQKFKKINLFR